MSKPDYKYIEGLMAELNDLHREYAIDECDAIATKVQTQIEDMIDIHKTASRDDCFLKQRYPHGIPAWEDM